MKIKFSNHQKKLYILIIDIPRMWEKTVSSQPNARNHLPWRFAIDSRPFLIFIPLAVNFFRDSKSSNATNQRTRTPKELPIIHPSAEMITPHPPQRKFARKPNCPQAVADEIHLAPHGNAISPPHCTPNAMIDSSFSSPRKVTNWWSSEKARLLPAAALLGKRLKSFSGAGAPA